MPHASRPLPFLSWVSLAGMLVILGACGSEPVPEATVPTTVPAAVTITAVAAQAGRVERSLTVIGTLEARDELVVAVEGAGGRITELGAEPGDRVAAGQVLVRLDPADIVVRQAQNTADATRATAAAQQAEATLAEANVVVADAKRAATRAETLAQAGTIGQEALEAKQTAAATAVARVSAAAAAKALAEADIARIAANRQELDLARQRTVVTAPQAGLVIERTAVAGAVVTPGTVLYRLAADGVIELAAEVDEDLLPRMDRDLPVIAEIGPVTLAGQVRRIDPQVERDHRAGRVRVAFATLADSDHPILHLGASARAHIRLDQESGVVVPLSALVHPEGQTQVVVIGSHGIAQRRAVVTGLDDGVQVVIRQGLAVGEDVVARAPGFVPDGMTVAMMRSAGSVTGSLTVAATVP